MTDGPRRLRYKKCTQCRKDKQKCEPQDRVWPGQKCDRCAQKNFDCSESVLAGQQASSPPERTLPIDNGWDMNEAKLTFSDYVELSNRITAISFSFRHLNDEPDPNLPQLRQSGILLHEEVCSNRIAVFRELQQAVIDSESDQMSFLLLSLFPFLNLEIECFGCQDCQDKHITNALPSLVEKATALSYYTAINIQYVILERTSPSTSDAVTEESYCDTISNIFTELPKMKAKNILPSISPGHVVLNWLGPEDLSNERLIKKMGNEFDSYGRSILHIGLENDWITDKNISPLMSVVNVNHQDSLGRTPLGLACSKSDESIASILIQHGAELDIPDKCGRTPLSWAAQYGLTSIMLPLIRDGYRDNFSPSKYQIQFDRKDDAGKTPLFYAIDGGHVDIIHLLLATGKVNPWPKSSDGQLPPRISNGLTGDNQILSIFRYAKVTHKDEVSLSASENNERNSSPLLPAVEESYGMEDDEFTMSDCSDDESPSHQKNQHASLGLSPPLPRTRTDNPIPEVDRIAIPQECNRKREWAEIKSSSGPGSGEFLRMLNAAKPWRGSVSSSKASSSIHSSLSIRTKGVEYLKGFRCCGRNWADLHQLLEHQETAHPESNPAPLSRIVLKELIESKKA